jgi:7,8-dihydroneopterin aldolase/epimerase/oxygenase
MSDVIELRGLRVSAIVGVLAEEREREQPLELDISFQRPFEQASMNDDLTVTTNYAAVITITEQIVREGKFLLLETLVYRVAHEILAYDAEIEEVTVSVRKLRPPVPQDIATVGVRTTVARR